ncbi:MAG: PKD domain-containing protein [Euryarchaeota archaeon]|nr:PKD domain-containing protein [Euryarchaeota archaeon]
MGTAAVKAMNRPAVLTVFLSMIVASGCFGEASPTSASPEPTDSSPTASETPTPSELPAANAPPTGGLNASVLEGAAPLNVTFNITGEDADGDALRWTLDADGDNASDAQGDSVPATTFFNYTEPGTYNATVTVSDGTASNSTTIVVVAISGVPAPVSRSDPTGDADADLMDVKLVELSFQDDKMVAVLSIVRVWPTTQAVSPFSYSLSVNGRQLDSFVRYPTDANPMTWDNGASAYMAAGTSTWDTTANKVTFKLPMTWIAETAKLKAPYQVHAAGNIGGVGATEENDRAPDTGEIIWG